MLGPTLSGAGFNWTATGAGGTRQLGNGSANITWSSAISMMDAEQVSIQVLYMSTQTLNMLMQGVDDPNTGTWSFILVDAIGAVTAAGAFGISVPCDVQAMNPKVRQWGPFVASPGATLGAIIERPLSVPFFRIGFWEDGAVGVNDKVNCNIFRQRGAQLQASGS